jgi:hypothetical protein
MFTFCGTRDPEFAQKERKHVIADHNICMEYNCMNQFAFEPTAVFNDKGKIGSNFKPMRYLT